MAQRSSKTRKRILTVAIAFIIIVFLFSVIGIVALYVGGNTTVQNDFTIDSNDFIIDTANTDQPGTINVDVPVDAENTNPGVDDGDSDQLIADEAVVVDSEIIADDMEVAEEEMPTDEVIVEIGADANVDANVDGNADAGGGDELPAEEMVVPPAGDEDTNS